MENEQLGQDGKFVCVVLQEITLKALAAPQQSGTQLATSREERESEEEEEKGEEEEEEEEEGEEEKGEEEEVGEVEGQRETETTVVVTEGLSLYTAVPRSVYLVVCSK